MITVLIVDGAPAHVAQCRDALERHGYRVLAAVTIDEGLMLARRHLPDIVLLDQFMPYMDGLHALRELAKCPATAHIPVVMLAARSNAAAKVRALWLGARDYLVKPVSESEIVGVVRSLTHLGVRESALA